ncbi:hypothetical protein PSS93_002545 [Enterococcus faecium]|uniref:hypothetical protein n=1 Tax=Enterococcus TaxID=1350 RepID=UPI000CF08C8A|nr:MULTISPECIES: hypothetical protein [Enterococcus]EGP5132648.1 hypothetical protein [Enterococcus faecium]EME7119116.1 hypothetical protein [Enterococcus faecium]EME7134481.1 hypothetical protein [Enterococcus faecium]EMF0549050.1 hypothetical protein [Enterococcus faecium]PQB78690.1 hypothetical protein CUN25_09755 [Enterococcus faecium]
MISVKEDGFINIPFLIHCIFIYYDCNRFILKKLVYLMHKEKKAWLGCCAAVAGATALAKGRR